MNPTQQAAGPTSAGLMLYWPTPEGKPGPHLPRGWAVPRQAWLGVSFSAPPFLLGLDET